MVVWRGPAGPLLLAPVVLGGGSSSVRLRTCWFTYVKGAACGCPRLMVTGLRRWGEGTDL